MLRLHHDPPHHDPSPESPGDAWRLDAAAREIVRGGRRVRLAEKPFLLLQALLAARGAVVTRAELRERLWSGDTFVDFDNNLNSAVATLRQQLGDSARAPRYVETIPKVGYRLVLGPDPAPLAPADPAAPPAPGPPRPRRRLGCSPAGALLAASAAGAALAAGAWSRSLPVVAPSSADREAQALFERGVYLRGRFLAQRQPELLEQAIELLAAASGRDPGFAGAVAERADALVELSFSGAVSFGEGLRRARDAASEALRLDPASAGAARALGIASLFLDWDLDASRTWLERAAATCDDAKTSLARATWFAAAGQPDAAVLAAERAVALDPAAHYVRADLAMFYLAAGRSADAAASSHQVLAVAPDFAPAMAHALLAHERLGQWPQAAAMARALMQQAGAPARELEQIDALEARAAVARWRAWDLEQIERRAAGRRPDFALQLALRHAALGERGAALLELEQALERRYALQVFLPAFPELAPLRADPAYQAIAQAVSAVGAGARRDPASD